MEEILLVHVLTTSPVPERSSIFTRSHTKPEEQAGQVLAEKGRYLEEVSRVPVKTLLVEAITGDIPGTIIKTANTENISLIVVGARGKSLFSGLLLGSVSEGVITRAGINVLIMHFQGIGDHDDTRLEKFCTNVFSQVLCPVDFSRPAEKTLEFLKSLGFVRKVTVLHITQAQRQGRDKSPPAQDPEQQLRLIADDLVQHGIRATVMTRPGNPVTEICHVADEQDASLIIMARYGKSDYAKNIQLGHVVAGVAAKAGRPLFIVSPHISLAISARELARDEFVLAEEVWLTYHQQKADPESDRIFGVFVEGDLAAVARCRRHPDGLEVDGVYVPDDYRDRGYARKAVQALVSACGGEPLYMHSTLPLAGFYGSFGFRKIGEDELPRSIRERFNFAEGDLEGANVLPMRRAPEK
jgi:nucleotide-binding universal stress UspA family protein/GNAT superfamily N-acetyltransferase